MKETETRYADNVIIVAAKPADAYVMPILKRMQPEFFEKFQEIKIQATMSNMHTVEYLIKLFKAAGLEEKNRAKTKIKVTNATQSYVLNEAYEIVLTKIPALRH